MGVNLLAIALFFTDMSDVAKAAAAALTNPARGGDEVYDTLYTTDADADTDVPAKVPNRPTTPTATTPEPTPVHLIPARSCCVGIDKTLDLTALLCAAALFFLTITEFAIFETILSKVVRELYGWGTMKAGFLFMGCGLVS